MKSGILGKTTSKPENAAKRVPIEAHIRKIHYPAYRHRS